MKYILQLTSQILLIYYVTFTSKFCYRPIIISGCTKCFKNFWQLS